MLLIAPVRPGCSFETDFCALLSFLCHLRILIGGIAVGTTGRAIQVAYQIFVCKEEVQGGTVQCAPRWDSGRIVSNASVNVVYAGPALAPGAAYSWNVTTWTAADSQSLDVACRSDASARSRFITALFDGWDDEARWIWTPPEMSNNRFGSFRRTVDLAGGRDCSQTATRSGGDNRNDALTPLRALLFASATVDPNILSAFKIYLGGELVAIGPGRGEARVRGGDGNFTHRVYSTLDVTSPLLRGLHLAGESSTRVVLAVEGQSPMGDKSWDSWDPYAKSHSALAPPAILVQLQISRADGTACTVVTEHRTGEWQSANADTYYHPVRNTVPMYSSGVMEHIDAREESMGWRSELDFFKTSRADWHPAVAQVDTRSNATGLLDFSDLHPKMARPVRVVEVPSRPLVEMAPHSASWADAEVVADNNTCAVKPSIHDDPRLRMLLSCPTGSIIDRVLFASFGSPIGSCATGLHHNRSCDSPSAVPSLESLCIGKTACNIPDSAGFFSPTGPQPGAKEAGCNGFPTPHTLAVSVGCGVHKRYTVDFEQEFEGGIVLNMSAGTAGHRVKISLGELMGDAAKRFENVTGSPLISADVAQTWGAEFIWTLRDGPQIISQHNYVNFRYAELIFLDGPPPPGLAVSAWGAAYEWNEDDSKFASSDPILNHVWRLCSNTLRYGVMGTYTDSNTRERRPYESDGIIAAANRLLLQRDRLWGRHSASWLLEFPTWPIEWQQQTSLLVLQDYMATGSADLAKAYSIRLLNDTKIKYIDGTGVIGKDTGHDTSFGGHIVGWDPAPGSCDPKPNCTNASAFHASDHETPCNAWGVHGLETLAEMAAAYGDRSHATELSKVAGELRQNILEKMWNNDAQHFCDGLCANQTSVNGSVYTDYTTLFLGLVPMEARATVWESIAAHGLENIGAYGAFLFLNALSRYPELGDNGTAIHRALTKCDETSWCAEWELYNATITMEAFPVDVVGGSSFSHLWGASAIGGIVHGLLGIHQTSPGYQTFEVKPRLGDLSHATVKIPTLYGFINVTASPNQLAVALPCNSIAKACVLSPAASATTRDRIQLRLTVDSEEVEPVYEGMHVCALSLGCGAGGRPRLVTVNGYAANE